MNENNTADSEKFLYKLILQFVIYTRGSNSQLDSLLSNITQSLKGSSNYHKLKPELIALSKTLHHISKLPKQQNKATSDESPNALQLQKEFIDCLINLLTDTNIPLKFRKRFLQLKQKSTTQLTQKDSKRVIDLALALIIEIKDNAVSEHQEIENFLLDMSQQFNQLEKYTLDVSSSNEISSENRDVLNNAISLEIENIKNSSSNAKDLPSLQEGIDRHMQQLTFQLIKHKKIELDRHIETKQQLADMAEKMNELEVETSALRNNLRVAHDKALRDALTGLPNRAAYDEKALLEYYRWYRYKNHLSFIIWDIDFFKKINDTFGHKAGDKTLTLVSQLILEHCRDSDFIARIGGEEFVMILPNTNVEQAKKVAEKTRNIISDSRFNHNGKAIKLTISCGISEFLEGDRLESVFERADKALYQSKENGRNCCTIFSK